MRTPLILRRVAAAGCLSLTWTLATGCASPGSPKPPLLDLPTSVTDLSAERMGDEVRLRWTTPSDTTDGLNIRGAITAQLCRGLPAASGQPVSCLPVHRAAVKAGASEIVDVLPPALTRGPAALLEYRVELRNSYERSAGQSSPALTVGGLAPPPVAGLQAEATEQGALVQWTSEDGRDMVELERTSLASPTKHGTGPAQASAKASVVDHLRVQSTGTSAQDAGGTLDPAPQTGGSFRYTALRVRHVELEGHTLELRSAPSSPVTVVMQDTFAPRQPAGVEAIVGKLAGVPGIDLSWTPNAEKDLAGYVVFRQEVTQSSGSAARQRITPVLVLEPAFRDATVMGGKAYVYTVVAVDTVGNQSLPSAPAREEVPQP